MVKPLYIGPAGWSYPDWNGVVYPERPRARFDYLAYLSSFFNLIEINSTFYRIPARSTCASWARRVDHRPDFRFTVKVFREFTHRSAPATATQRDCAGFSSAVEPLVSAGRLSAVLVQFPWSFRFTPDTARYVMQLVRWLAPLPVSVEVRHGSWGGDDAARLFEDSAVTMCGIDQPLIGNSLSADHFALGGAGAYFRLHGRNRAEWFKRDANRDSRYDYLYSKDELSGWVSRIDRAAVQANRTHVVLNNHFRGQAVANALAIAAMISGKRVPVPPGIARTYAGFGDLFESADKASDEESAQRSLFEDCDGQ
jgi:uncharacterized protein YecE (DUF72 family)